MKIGIDHKPFIFLLGIACSVVSCIQDKYTTITGKTMGTYYSIQYRSTQNYQAQIDSILGDFISAASTYDSKSEISQFNRDGYVVFKSPHLFRMLTEAREIHRKTNGAFEPTLMPLINAYGFGYKKRIIPNQQIVDSLLSLVSFTYLEFDSTKLVAVKKGVQLDLSAMGEGYAIELISGFLEQRKITDYKVEIGGEMKCKGKNPDGEYWLIGIQRPGTHHETMTSVRLRNEAISTSGSYRKFYTENGRHQSHIINPRSGRSVQNNLLSVTMRGKSAIEADAFATAGMVMGLDSVKDFVRRQKVEAFVIYQENDKVLSWHSGRFFE